MGAGGRSCSEVEETNKINNSFPPLWRSHAHLRGHFYANILFVQISKNVLFEYLAMKTVINTAFPLLKQISISFTPILLFTEKLIVYIFLIKQTLERGTKCSAISLSSQKNSSESDKSLVFMLLEIVIIIFCVFLLNIL